jgi:GTPase
MFIDEARIFLKAGNGGDGCISFRREKNVARGGPNGGNGGKGGDMIIEASFDLATLVDFQYKSHLKSERGQHGMGYDRYGKKSEDLIIKVPVGTLIKLVHREKNKVYVEGEIIADLTKPGQKIIVAKGGRGGRGNAAFKSATNRAPMNAEKGEEGEEVILKLELKLIADVGFIGYPNAGKSTLLSKLSNAHPKVAPYPFTTLEPYLGVMEIEFKAFILADLPGLIEGAHKGKGLGDRFLRHAERTKVILHVVDLVGYEGKDPVLNFQTINHEMISYNSEFKNRLQIVVANKIDLEEAKKNLDVFAGAISKKGYKVIPVSGATGEGLDELRKEITRALKENAETQKL